MPEAWLRGPVEGVPPRLMSVAHSLTDALEEIEAAASRLTLEELWLRPDGAASVGFHLRHAGQIVATAKIIRGLGLGSDRGAPARPRS